MKVRTLLPLIVALAAHAVCAENPVGDLLVKARELDGLKRIPRASFFTGEGDTELVFMEFRADEEGSVAELLSLKRDGSWIGSRLGLSPAGELRSWKFVRDTAFVEPRPEQIAEATVEGKTLTFTKDGKPMGSCEIPDGGVVDTGTAFLILPAYYDLLPEELHFSIVADDAIHPGFKMTHSKLDEEREAVVLVGPGGLHAEFNVSTVEATRGKILSLNVGGEVSIQVGAEEGQKLLKELMAKGEQAKAEATPATPPPAAGAATPEAAVKALIAAAASGDMQKVGACFSPKAPGEFQSLIDGSCPPDQFKGFCELFSNATVKGVEVDPKNPARATVAVGLGEREESLTVVKEANGWKVLDF